MNYIKLFEDLDTDEENQDMLNCEDVIKSISEGDDDIEVTGYQVGYYGHEFRYGSQGPSSESDKRCIRFNISKKDRRNQNNIPPLSRPLNFQSNLKDIDDSIILLRNAKVLYSRFTLYCKEINCEFVNMCVRFRLHFPLVDPQILNHSKIVRIKSQIMSFLSDWRENKQFYSPYSSEIFKMMTQEDIDKLNKPSDRYIKKITSESSFMVIKFKTSDIFDNATGYDTNIIDVRLNGFKYKTDDSDDWRPITLKPEQIKIAVDWFIERIKKNYRLKQDINNGNLEISIKNNNVVQLTIK